MKISVVIPAHNEEAFIGNCLSSIKTAEVILGASVEVVVCLNRLVFCEKSGQGEKPI